MLKLTLQTFFTHFPDLFIKILEETNFELFQASGIFHVLPQIKFRIFQNKYIVSVDASKPLSLISELHRFFFYKSVIFGFFGFDLNALKKNSYGN